jgi:hypothetical protein
MNSTVFFNIKNMKECLELDQNIINSIIESFSGHDNKHKKKVISKKPLNILKNPKLKSIIDKTSNKVNLILNKLSENNIDNLVIEFIENVKITTIEDYNDYLKTFYLKILSEINFYKFYFKFFDILSNVYFNVLSFSNEYFYNLVEKKFTNDYLDYIEEEYDFLKEITEDEKRTNNLLLIKNMVLSEHLKPTINDYINEVLLNQNKYLADIHFWFKDNTLTNDQTEKIKYLLTDDIQLRDKILLENLINGTNNNIINNNASKIIFKKKNDQPSSNNTIQLQNLLEEYLFIDNSESIEDYIINECDDINSKNKFCEFIVDKYFKLTATNSNKILKLIKLLIKKKILFKSNLSRGLLNVNNNKTPQDKLKTLLLHLKNMGITNSLETLMNKYKIEINT